MVVGHSVGASILIRWLSERKDETTIAGVFLVACPFWGGDGWRYEGYEELALPPGFESALPPGIPVYLYHCRDDATVPFDHLAHYAQALPEATVPRSMKVVANSTTTCPRWRDIASLPS